MIQDINEWLEDQECFKKDYKDEYSEDYLDREEEEE